MYQRVIRRLLDASHGLRLALRRMVSPDALYAKTTMNLTMISIPRERFMQTVKRQERAYSWDLRSGSYLGEDGIERFDGRYNRG